MTEVIALYFLASVVGFSLSSGVLGGYFIATGTFLGIDFARSPTGAPPLQLALGVAAGPALVLMYVLSSKGIGVSAIVMATLMASVWSLISGLIVFQALLSF